MTCFRSLRVALFGIICCGCATQSIGPSQGQALAGKAIVRSNNSSMLSAAFTNLIGTPDIRVMKANGRELGYDYSATIEPGATTIEVSYSYVTANSSYSSIKNKTCKFNALPAHIYEAGGRKVEGRGSIQWEAWVLDVTDPDRSSAKKVSECDETVTIRINLSSPAPEAAASSPR